MKDLIEFMQMAKPIFPKDGATINKIIDVLSGAESVLDLKPAIMGSDEYIAGHDQLLKVIQDALRV